MLFSTFFQVLFCFRDRKQRLMLTRTLSNAYLITCKLEECLARDDDFEDDGSKMQEAADEKPEAQTEIDVILVRMQAVGSKDLEKRIGARLISALKQSEELHLSNQRLEFVEDDAFVSFSGSKSLYLSSNLIRALSPGAFSNLAALGYLLLNDNKISFLEERIFDSLGNLENLSLANNELTRLTRRTFSKLRALQSLNLSENKLSFEENGCDKDLFWDLENLTELNLYCNQFKVQYCGTRLLASQA